MNANTPEAVFKEMPPITRAILVGTFGVTLFFVLGLLNVQWILLDWVLVTKKLHIWRLFTDYLFVGPFSFSWLFHAYFFVTFSSKLESHPSFSSRLIGHGGYLYFVCLQMIALDVISLIFYPPTGKRKALWFKESKWDYDMSSPGSLGSMDEPRRIRSRLAPH